MISFLVPLLETPQGIDDIISFHFVHSGFYALIRYNILDLFYFVNFGFQISPFPPLLFPLPTLVILAHFSSL